MMAKRLVNNCVNSVYLSLTLCASLCCFLFSASAFANDYQRFLPPDKLHTLLIGEQSYDLIHQPAAIPISLGMAWIFASPGQSQLTIVAAQELARELNQYGWHTVIVPADWLSRMPVSAAASMKPDDTSDRTTQDGNVDTVSTPMPWQSELTQSLTFESAQQGAQSMVSALHDRYISTSGFRLIIAEGMVASALLSVDEGASMQLPDALAVVAPFWPDYEINTQVPAFSAAFPAPLLDITTHGNRWSQVHAKQRAMQANVDLKMHYRQQGIAQRIPSARAPHTVRKLGKAIIGWTRALGW